jgi:hypothetical protein
VPREIVAEAIQLYASKTGDAFCLAWISGAVSAGVVVTLCEATREIRMQNWEVDEGRDYLERAVCWYDKRSMECLRGRHGLVTK